MKNNVLVVVLVLIIAVFGIGYYINYQEEHKTPGERIGKAVEELGDGIKDSSREMQDRSVGEKMEDAIDDAKEEMKNVKEKEY